MRTSSARLLMLVAVAAACSKPAPEPAPAPVRASRSAAECREVAKRLAQYPNQMIEQEPMRLSGAFPRIAPARRDTSFTVSFVVDTAGKPVVSTFTVSRHVGTRFSAELKKSVAGWRYAPASFEGCPVRRKVSHTIDTGAPRRRTSMLPRADGDATYAERSTQHAAGYAERRTQNAEDSKLRKATYAS